MAENEIEVFETTAGQVIDVLGRLGVAKERMVTVVVEPDAPPSRQAPCRLSSSVGSIATPAFSNPPRASKKSSALCNGRISQR